MKCGIELEFGTPKFIYGMKRERTLDPDSDYIGAEIASPIFNSFDEMREWLKTTLPTLKDCIVTEHSDIHIHISDVLNDVPLEEQFTYLKYKENDILNRFKGCINKHNRSSKYISFDNVPRSVYINVKCSYKTHGTIEFRLFKGSLDYKTINNYIAGMEDIVNEILL